MNLYITCRRYFDCIGKITQFFFMSVAAFILNGLLMYFVVVKRNEGLTGVGVCASVSLGFQMLVCEVYTYFQSAREHKAKWLLPSRALWLRVPTFMRYGVPCIFTGCLAMFPIEIFCVFAGWIGTPKIEASVVLNNIFFVLCHVPSGL